MCLGQEWPCKSRSLGLGLDGQLSLFPSWKWLLWKVTQNSGDQKTREFPNHILPTDPCSGITQGLAPPSDLGNLVTS